MTGTPLNGRAVSTNMSVDVNKSDLERDNKHRSKHKSTGLKILLFQDVMNNYGEYFCGIFATNIYVEYFSFVRVKCLRNFYHEYFS